MKHSRLSAFKRIGLVSVLAVCFATTAFADDYADVMQLMRQGKHAEALSKADQYLSGKPKDAQMRFLKGVIQRDAGKSADAIATFTKLTEDYPELPEPYNNLAVLYASQSQFDKARAALEMAIRTNPSYATAHENLGDVYAKLASQAYNKALQLDSANTAVAPKLALIRELFNPAGPRTAPAAATATKAPPPAAVKEPQPAAPVATPATPASKEPAPAVATAGKEPTPAPALATNATSGSKDAQAAVQAWAAAWAAKDMKAYLGAYGKDFTPPNKLSRAAWEEERRNRITTKNNISVKLEHLTVTVNGNTAIAKFKQDYRASGLSVSSRKTLELNKVGERWLIVKESTS
ncbi:tetratricopeptide repeat protein [Curvibacter sp. APW13]|uniref:L,D-transpeptidase Cds6 family protein n=1 Tax=Curvibacter sp. APW13 TaxID=3077236 RepID=UPI0028DE88A1|nr:tetratricopeptide repeat protein [Curvibacter sp. APW13]MDT8991424.1 tetratricopeptide repeat protein [Curvibacter sp. APW13]